MYTVAIAYAYIYYLSFFRLGDWHTQSGESSVLSHLYSLDEVTADHVL